MTPYQFHVDGTLPAEGAVFVFGSNLAGRHGAGAAKVARDRFGAKGGVGRGPTGWAYAIPTKDARQDLKDPGAALPLDVVATHVADFLAYARSRPELQFFVTRVGCGLAGHADRDVAVLFRGAPDNCSFPAEWKPFISPAPTAAPSRPRLR